MEPKFKTIRELICDSSHYYIPPYQRDYAWGIAEVQQLVEDVAIAAISDVENQGRYYIGTLITNETYADNDSSCEEKRFEVIDGQQRLTTLHLIYAQFANEKGMKSACNIEYSHVRPQYKEFMQHLYTGDILGYISSNKDAPIALSCVYVALPSIFKDVCDKLAGKVSVERIINYLLNNVELLQISVPEQTDLNHYFRIMNMRGEQLEKHEILKARLISKLRCEDSNQFADRWDECSSFFAEYSKKMAPRFDDAVLDTDSKSSSIANLIRTESLNKFKEAVIASRNTIDSNQQIHRSVVNFPNFLMIALRIFVESHKIQYSTGFVPLDDTKLLQIFSDIFKLNTEPNPDLIADFGKLIADLLSTIRKYIIIYHDGRWCISSDLSDTPISKDRKRVVALQTLFHSSAVGQKYKYWLYVALKQDDKAILGTFTFWEELARLYLSGRYSSVPLDYNVFLSNKRDKNLTLDRSRLTYHHHIVFALKLYDYILWRENLLHDDNCEELIYTADRNSVEHFYPQQPDNKAFLLDGNDPKSPLHSIGNLCLISASINSKFTNLLPAAKKDQFPQIKHYSIKLEEMMGLDWDYKPETSIEDYLALVVSNITKQTTIVLDKLEKFLSEDS